MAARSQPASRSSSDPSGPASARIDVWLWSVRQIKSRSAATSACKAGTCALTVRLPSQPSTSR